MHRKSTPLGSELEALFDERDHLQIQVSIASEAEPPNACELDALHKRLSQLEDEIASTWNRLRST